MGLSQPYLNQRLNVSISADMLNRIESALAELEKQIKPLKIEIKDNDVERAEALKKKMKKLNCSYSALAKYMNTSVNSICGWLNRRNDKKYLDRIECAVKIIEETGETPSRPREWVKKKIVSALLELKKNVPAEAEEDVPCVGCVWKQNAGEGKLVCIFPDCVVGREDILNKYCAEQQEG